MTDYAKIERSIPVQSRIDIVRLAELDAFFNEQGCSIKTMSQLVSRSVDLCYEALENSKMLKARFESVVDAYNHMEYRQLFQRALKKRTMAKIATAMGFENLRLEGEEPETVNPVRYKQVHNARRSYNERDRFMPRHLTEQELETKAKRMEERERRQRAIYEAMNEIPEENIRDDKSIVRQNDGGGKESQS